MLYDTIAAVATPLSPSGIGIIRISGDDAVDIADKIFMSKKKTKRISEAASHSLNYGYIYDYKEEKVIDEVLVSVMKEPNSFTKENVVEINAHGGVVVIQKILRMVLNNGARLAEPGEFTKRAFLNGRIDLSQAEAVIDIINSENELALDSSVNQLKGSVSEKINEIKDMLLSLIAHIEASIDYPEYDIDELSFDSMEEKLKFIKEKIQDLLVTYDDGRMIKEGIKTVIIGRPNVGKSSLLNLLLKEQRAIVTEIPGTTRDVLEEYMNIKGVPLKLVDTAGIHDTNDIVEKIGVERSKEYIEKADLVLFIIDASEKIKNEDIEIIKLLNNKKVIILLNKIDLEVKAELEMISKLLTGHKIISISVKNNIGLNELENEIKNLFIVGKINVNNQVYITNVRHKNALDKSMISLEQVMNSLSSNMAEDFLAIDLKNVYESICEITGDSINEDLVNKIFSQFCLGK